MGSLDEILSCRAEREAFNKVVGSRPESRQAIGELLVAIANEPLHRYRRCRIAPGEVQKLTERLLADAKDIQRVNTRYFSALSDKLWWELYKTLPDLLRDYAEKISTLKSPSVSRRPAEHRRTFEFYLVDLIRGDDEGRPHYKEAAILLNAAYAVAERKHPPALKKLFQGKQAHVDADELQKAYTRHKARRVQL